MGPATPASLGAPESGGAPGAGMRMAELLASLSFAIDLGVGMPMEWVLRACLMSMRLGEAAGLDLARRRNLYYLALLRHVGCTSTAAAAVQDFGDDHGMARGFELDLDNPAEGLLFLFTVVAKDKPLPKRMAILARLLAQGEGIKVANRSAHCEVAERLAARLGIDPGLPALFRQIYARWDGKGTPKGLQGNDLALEVRVLHVAYDAATLFAAGGKDVAIAAVRKRAGGLFDPDLAALFLKHADAMLAPLAEVSAWDAVLAAEPGAKARIPPERLDAALLSLADFADLKTPFTLGHARAVSDLAGDAARLAGLNAEEARDLRRAAWLQDLGRVGVAGSVWAKPGPLNEGERERVRLHPYFTERILARAPFLARWADLAALHHERLDGSGYHRRAPAAQIPMTARLLAAADAYQAMREDRPHRSALTEADAAAELRREAKQGKLDVRAVDAVLRAAGHVPPARGAETKSALSAREIEVLRLAARGLSNRRMGEALFISPKTVGHHLAHIYAKIGVSTRAGATLYAMEQGLLE